MKSLAFILTILAINACAADQPKNEPFKSTWVFDPATLQPFTTIQTYEGQQTGLYPDGQNLIPEAHRKAGEKIAATIQPLDENGKPDPQNGRILSIVMGHSNCRIYFRTLNEHLTREKASRLNPRYELLNCAVDGNQLPEIHGNPNGPVWQNIDKLTSQPGYSPKQVQVLFLHTTWHGWRNMSGNGPRPFPDDMKKMQSALHDVLKRCVEKLPNLKLAYLTSDGFRQFTGFEPHVFREAFAYKWLIAAQINGEANTAFEGPGRVLPWLQWGAYIWDNTWDASYFGDGVHPSAKGQKIFAEKYTQFLSADPVAAPWLFKPNNR